MKYIGLERPTPVNDRIKIDGPKNTKFIILLPWNHFLLFFLINFGITYDDIQFSGSLGVETKGPSKLDLICDDSEIGHVKFSYIPEVPGKYEISIMCDGVAIPDSPFTVIIDVRNWVILRTRKKHEKAFLFSITVVVILIKSFD